MNIEELKLVLQTIQGISGDASTAAILWVALHYGSGIITGLLTAGTILGMVYLVIKAIMANTEWANAVKEVCKAYGCNDDYSFITTEQKRALRKAIERSKT